MGLRNFLIFSIVILYLCPNCQSTFSWPDLSATSGKFETYTIDFRVLDSARGTYWSLCNWFMDDNYLTSKYSDITGGGAYGGLQILSNGTRVAIISLWDTYYKENGVKKTMHVTRVYPGDDQIFTGSEGEGSTLRDFYNWKDGTWYRYVLHSWEDFETGHTYIGNWIQDLSTQQWTLFAYFDIGYQYSFILASWKKLHMFQELFDKQYWYYERSFQIRNMYIFDREYRKWISINSTYLSLHQKQ